MQGVRILQVADGAPRVVTPDETRASTAARRRPRFVTFLSNVCHWRHSRRQRSAQFCKIMRGFDAPKHWQFKYCRRHPRKVQAAPPIGAWVLTDLDGAVALRYRSALFWMV